MRAQTFLLEILDFNASGFSEYTNELDVYAVYYVYMFRDSLYGLHLRLWQYVAGKDVWKLNQNILLLR